MVLIEDFHEETDKSADPEKSLQLKEEGNKAFQSKDFLGAVQLYSQALEIQGDDISARTILLSNRAACQIQLNEWDKAISDTSMAISLDGSNVKAYHRKATAERKRGDLKQAILTLQTGLTFLKASDETITSPLQKLLTSFENIGKKNLSSSSASKKKTSGFMLNQSGLFGDTPRESEGDRILSRLRESISSSSGSQTNNDLDGVFKKLLDKKYFEKTVFPGLTPEQREGCPSSLRELLDSPLYSACLEKEAVPEAMTKARSVMDNVKKRGAEAGDFMDSQTEATLWPQVVNEALARAIVSMVQRLHRRQHLLLSRDPRFEATTPMLDYFNQLNMFSPTETVDEEITPPWEFEQLDDDCLHGLLLNSFGKLDDFMSDEWPQLILEDVFRFIEPRVSSGSGGGGGKNARSCMYSLPVPERTKEGSYGDMAWLPYPDELANDYPALAEVVTNLHALPFELNRFFRAQKVETVPISTELPSLHGLRLTRAMPSATALVRLKPGEFQPMRVDCDSGLLRQSLSTPNASDEECHSEEMKKRNDTGYRITALYFLPIPSGEGSIGGDLALQNVLQSTNAASEKGEIQQPGQEAAETTGLGPSVFDPISDRLILWRSDIVSNERRVFTGSKITQGCEQNAMYAILFWMHGVEKE